jgi:beta-xylosidase
LTLHRLSDDGRRVADEGRTIVDGHALPGYSTLEGPKLYKRGGWYYVFAPAGGVARGWQSVFRSRSIDGPYEARIVMRQGGTPVNGPHQGSWVETAAGEDWFLHFQDKDAYGRVVHLQPLAWRDDGWPVIGADPDGDGIGEPVPAWRKPKLPRSPAAAPATSDEFDAPRLGLQWQWQANPRDGWTSLAAKPGALRLHAQRAPSLWLAPHLLLQKWPAPEFVATTSLSFAPAALDESAGLVVFGHDYAWLGLRKTASGPRLTLRVCRDARNGSAEQEQWGADASASSVVLRVNVAAGGRCHFSYSTDGKRFQDVGETFVARPGHWVGAKVGLFALAGADAGSGHADVDWFRVTTP